MSLQPSFSALHEHHMERANTMYDSQTAPLEKRNSIFKRIFGKKETPSPTVTANSPLTAPVGGVFSDHCPTTIDRRINLTDNQSNVSCTDVVFANSMYVAIAMSNKTI